MSHRDIIQILDSEEGSLIRSIIYSYVTCRRFEGRPFHGQPPLPLPPFRVKEEPPFSCTAIDFAGPLYINMHGVTKCSRVWICLYTCCVTQAMHLDVVPDLSTHTFIRSLKQFCTRRGIPHKLLSDNGKTFKAAAKVVGSIMDQQDVKQYLSQIGVKWCFNLEKAPWWGGVFERLIKPWRHVWENDWSGKIYSWWVDNCHQGDTLQGEQNGPKYPMKVHVWAGISKREQTGICIFEGIMNAELFIDILDKILVTFIKRVYPEGHEFMQDNDPSTCQIWQNSGRRISPSIGGRRLLSLQTIIP